MKTRIFSLAMAGMMTVQMTAHAAAPSRVDGIGDQAIATAQTDLAQLKEQIAAFDDSLANAEFAILNKENRGSLTNGLAISAGAMGLVLGGLALFYAKKEINPGSPTGSAWGILVVPAIATVSLISTVAGFTSSALKATANTPDLKTSLDQTEKAIAGVESQKLSSQEAQLIAELKKSLQETKKALASYEQNSDEVSRNRLAAQAAQFGGIVLGVASLVASINDGYKYSLPGGSQLVLGAGMALGGAAAMGGNLATIIMGLKSVNTETVLKEIRSTRKALRQIKEQL